MSIFQQLAWPNYSDFHPHITFFQLIISALTGLMYLFVNSYPFGITQAFHRHIPILVRALGSTCSELLHIISDPPQGSENLLTLVSLLFLFF